MYGRNLAEWKPGHPRFAPFEINQKVVLRVAKVGNRLGYKFQERCKGHYKVRKVQPNGVTYEIENCTSAEVVRAHHKQLRQWKDPPEYLKPFIDHQSVTARVDESEGVIIVAEGVPFLVSSTEDSDEERTKRKCLSRKRSSYRESRKEIRKLRQASRKENSTQMRDGKLRKVNAQDRVLRERGCPSLRNLRCSEEVEEDVRQSTPILEQTNCLGFSQYLGPSFDGSGMFEILVRTIEEQEECMSIIEKVATQLSLSEEVSGTRRQEFAKYQNNQMECISNNAEMLANRENYEFSGFTNNSFKEKKSAVNELQDMIAQARLQIRKGRLRSQLLRKEIHEYQDSKTRGSFGSLWSSKGGMMSETERKSPAEVIGASGRALRSKGPVASVPLVQAKTLEYALRRKQAANVD